MPKKAKPKKARWIEIERKHPGAHLTFVEDHSTNEHPHAIGVWDDYMTWNDNMGEDPRFIYLLTEWYEVRTLSPDNSYPDSHGTIEDEIHAFTFDNAMKEANGYMDSSDSRIHRVEIQGCGKGALSREWERDGMGGWKVV